MGAALSKDGWGTKVIEGIPVAGITLAVPFHAKAGNYEHVKRATGKCLNSTMVLAGTVAGGLVGGPAGAFAGGALGGAAGVTLESAVARDIDHDTMKKECAQFRAEDYAVGAWFGALGGAVGAIGGTLTSNFGQGLIIGSATQKALRYGYSSLPCKLPGDEVLKAKRNS